jgi:hypothetical protein
VRPPDLSGIKAPVLLIRGRYDRIDRDPNHIADWHLVLLNH